jgi:hypothetical protein
MKKINLIFLTTLLNLWGCQQQSQAVNTPPIPSVQASPVPSPAPSAKPLPSPSTSASASASAPQASATPPASPAPSPSTPSSPLSTAVPRSQPQIQMRYVGQLFYQLDCVAGQPNCSREQYAQLWEQSGFFSTESNRFSAWNALKAPLDRTVLQGNTLSNLAEPLVFQSQNRWDQIRGAALESDTIAEFDTKLKPLVSDAVRQEMLGHLDYFSQGFFERWWQQTGKAQSLQLLSAYADVFTQYDINSTIEAIARFYESGAPPLDTLQFHLMLQAPGAQDLSLAEQILNHGVIEVSPSQSPHSQLDVMIHEMTHYFFKQLPATTQAKIQGFFAQQPEAYAMSAYHLFDESLATAIGNGRINEKVLRPDFFANLQRTPNGFFADPFIDANGKALFLSRLTEAPDTVSSTAFLAAYYKTAQQAVNLNQVIPSLRLSAVYFADSSLQRVMPELQGRLKPWAQFVLGQSAGPGYFERYPRLNGMLWFGNTMDALETWRSLLGEKAYSDLKSAPSGPFVYGVQTPQRQFYIFKSPSEASDSALIQLLLRQPENFSGFKRP